MTLKVSISPRTVIRAANAAKARGVSPARRKRFWSTVDKWVPNANARTSRQLDELVKTHPLPSPGWLPSWLPGGVQDAATRWTNWRKLNRNLKQQGAKGVSWRPEDSAQDAAYVASAFGSDQKLIRSPKSWPILSHEAGHAVDHLANRKLTFSQQIAQKQKPLRPQGMTDSVDGVPSKVLLQEARANLYGARLARQQGFKGFRQAIQPSRDSHLLYQLQRLRETSRTRGVPTFLDRDSGYYQLPRVLRQAAEAMT